MSAQHDATHDVDLFVIGGGSGGVRAARGRAQRLDRAESFRSEGQTWFQVAELHVQTRCKQKAIRCKGRRTV